MTKADEICAAYEARFLNQEAFTTSVVILCKTILEANGIEIAAIESRTKSVESLKGKINRPDKAEKYNSTEDITDLSGVRVILFLKEDCDQAINLFSKNMKVDRNNSTDKDYAEDPDRFGYTSRHLVISHTDERCKLIDFKPHAGLKEEIQVRTVLQHAWAAIDWRLRYKSENEIPKQLRRRLYRISALLESADEEFSNLDVESKKIIRHYSAIIKSGRSDIALDGESLKIFLLQDVYWLDLSEKIRKSGVNIAKEAGSIPSRLSLCLNLLKAMNLTSIGEVRSNLKANEASIIEKISSVFSDWKSQGGKGLSPEATLRMAMLVASGDRAEFLIGNVKLAQPLLRALCAELGLPVAESKPA